MYCVKCRKTTESVDVHEVTTKNNRLMQKAKFKECNTTKCKFLKKNNDL